MRTELTYYFRLMRWLHQFEEQPRYHRFGAGLYQLLWTRYCGYEWPFAWRMACIYWSPVTRVRD